jgi:hypothetical protein
MLGMAKAFRMGIERNAKLVEVFTRGMEGEDWFVQPPGVPNPAIWTLGHIAYHRGLFYEMVTGECTYPETWRGVFGMGCKPLADAHAYPPVEVCHAYMEKALGLLGGYLESVTARGLALKPTIESRFLPTKADVLSHLICHEAHHTGNLALVRRLLGKDKVI